MTPGYSPAVDLSSTGRMTLKIIEVHPNCCRLENGFRHPWPPLSCLHAPVCPDASWIGACTPRRDMWRNAT